MPLSAIAVPLTACNQDRRELMRLISLEIVTVLERQQTIDSIREIIAAVDGWIEDFRIFSNISIMIRSALPCRNAIEFGQRLMDFGLNLPDPTMISLAEQNSDSGEDADFSCTLNVTFVHDDDDLRIEVPAVPG